MGGIKWPLPEDSDHVLQRQQVAVASSDLVSDDDRSVAADSWSIKSEYGSTLDDEQRHVDASDALSAANFRAASDYSSDKDEAEGNDDESSMLGLQSYWDSTYAEDLANYHEHGQAGEIWFGAEVMDTVVSWTKKLCLNMLQHHDGESNNCKSESGNTNINCSAWSALDIGTGNGLLLHELAKQGFCDLTGTDYSEGAIELAKSIAIREGFPTINFFVDDILETKLDKKFQLVMDKGTLDAIGLHPEGPLKKIMYWESVTNLVAPGGILVITSCNNTKDELIREVDNFNRRNIISQNSERNGVSEQAVFEYVDHIRTYPTIMFGGVEGSRVSTVAFVRK